jgi:hypothetical protein
MPGFICRQCGQYHDNLPLGYRFAAPAYWSAAFAQDEQSQCGEEICIIQAEHFFIKGNIEIPVTTTGGLFNYTVWVAVGKDDFQRATSLWQNPKRSKEAAYAGIVANQLIGYPDTLHLEVKVHTREVGFRPYLALEAAEHPLVVEQQQGIEITRVQEIAALVIHHDK